MQIPAEEFGDLCIRHCPEDLPENVFYGYVTRLYSKNNFLWDDFDEEDEFYQKTNARLALDIFVLDDVPDSSIQRKISSLKTKMIYGLPLRRRYKMEWSKYKGIIKLFVWVLSGIGSLNKKSTILKMYHKQAQKYNGKGYSGVWSRYYTFTYIATVFEKKWFEQTVELPIRGHMFMAPQGYKEVLSTMFGDYMKLPPEEERIPKHIK